MAHTFTDWEFHANIETAKKLAADFWPQVKAARANDFRATNWSKLIAQYDTLEKKRSLSSRFR